MERSVRGRATRDRARRASERSAPDRPRLGDGRDRRITVDAARHLRVLPSPALADCRRDTASAPHDRLIRTDARVDAFLEDTSRPAILSPAPACVIVTGG